MYNDDDGTTISRESRQDMIEESGRYAPYESLSSLAKMPIVEEEDIGLLIMGGKESWVCLNASEYIDEPPSNRGINKEKLQFDEESEIGFVTNIFKWRGTALGEIWPQVLAIMAMTATASAVVYVMSNNKTRVEGSLFELPKDVKQVHSILAATLGFLVVNRSSQAFTNYIDGRKALGGICNNVREVAQLIYTCKLRPGYDNDKVLRLQILIRRKLNLLYTFIRHHLREASEGFRPGCSIEKEDFATHWHLDPANPPIGNLISMEEKMHYSSKPTSMRPAVVQAELNMLANELAEYTMYPGFFVQMFMKNTEDVMNLFKTCYRIVETDVPMPYQHMLYTLIFIYSFITPWIYCSEVASNKKPRIYDGTNMTAEEIEQKEIDYQYHFMWSAGWAASLLVCVAYYGIMEIAAKLHNPFGHDLIDHDLEMFGERCHNETLVISKSVKAGDVTHYIDGTGLNLQWQKQKKTA